MPIFLRALFLSQMNFVEFCQKLFSATTEMIIWILSFSLLIQCITLIDLCMLENPCISGVRPPDHDA